MGEKLEKGDIAFLDYETWVSQPDGSYKLHDTTREELAKKEGIHQEKRIYGPVPVLVGGERLLKGFDEAVTGAPVGEEQEVILPPDKGAGERDPKLVQIQPLREFHRREIDPHVGDEVTLSGRRGLVTAVTAGRVRVDFNHPLAGRSLKYKFLAVKRAHTPEEKVRGVLEMDYGVSDLFQVSVEKDAAEIQLADLCKTDEKWYIAKFRVVADLRLAAGIKTIRFIERYEERGLQAEQADATATVEASVPAAEPEAPPEEAPPPAEKPSKAEKPKSQPRRRPKEEKAPEEL
jgi:FKBP-type peptidyl-prolyl cis-trans isomerase 2